MTKPETQYRCGVANHDGTSCGRWMGHDGLHEFTVPAPEEYFEDEVSPVAQPNQTGEDAY